MKAEIYSLFFNDFNCLTLGKVIENDKDALNFYRRMSMMAPNEALAVDTFFLLW